MSRGVLGAWAPLVGYDTCIGEFNAQLYGVLVSLLDLGSERMEIVCNNVKGMGLVAWRRLCTKYDPSNPQTNLDPTSTPCLR